MTSPATVVYEQVNSRKGQVAEDRSSSIDWTLRLVGSDILDDVISSAMAVFPAAVFEPTVNLWLVPSRWTYTPLGPGRAASQTPKCSWDATCTFVDPAKADNQHQLDVGECRLQASTTGGTAKIFVSLETVGMYTKTEQWQKGALIGPSPTIPNFHQACGVTRQNEVQGVEKVVPACKFTVQTRKPISVVTNAALVSWEALTGTYNNATWWARDAGEVLFLGVDVTVGTKSDPTLDFHFLRVPNLTTLMIGDIGPITKLGHHFLWVLFEESPQSAAAYMPAVPRAVYVERIYEPSDFSALGLGTTSPLVPAWPPL